VGENVDAVVIKANAGRERTKLLRYLRLRSHGQAWSGR